jgi:hypothetical protein
VVSPLVQAGYIPIPNGSRRGWPVGARLHRVHSGFQPAAGPRHTPRHPLRARRGEGCTGDWPNRQRRQRFRIGNEHELVWVVPPMHARFVAVLGRSTIAGGVYDGVGWVGFDCVAAVLAPGTQPSERCSSHWRIASQALGSGGRHENSNEAWFAVLVITSTGRPARKQGRDQSRPRFSFSLAVFAIVSGPRSGWGHRLLSSLKPKHARSGSALIFGNGPHPRSGFGCQLCDE